jgi:MFS family permease
LAVNLSGRSHTLAFAALRSRDCALYILTSSLVMMCDSVEHIVTYWVLFHTFRSPWLAGYAVISHWAPHLLFAVWTGALADRFNCRRLLIGSYLGYMGVSLAWAALLLSGTLELWQAVALLTAHGLISVVGSPASQLLVYEIAGSAHLQSAVRLSATGRQLGQLFGPAVGGLLMVVLGPGTGMLVNSALHLPGILWLRSVRYTGHPAGATIQARRAGFVVVEVVALLRQLAGNRAIVAMVLLVGASALFVGNAMQSQMPEYANDLGTDMHGIAYSTLQGASAGGAVLGGVLLEAGSFLSPSPATAIVAGGLWCLALIGFAATPHYGLALALLALAGVFRLTSQAMAQTLVQIMAPPRLRGRIIGVFNMSQLGLQVGAGFTVGILGGVIGARLALAASALAALAVCGSLLAFVLRRQPAAVPELVLHEA